jgi:ABC-2 type transport system ATP-binding protein
MRAIEAAGLEIIDLAVERPTLDDVFMTLTGHGASSADDVDGGSDQVRTRSAS